MVIVWRLWVDDWLVTGSQDRRRELLERKAAIEAVTGWAWSPPFSYDNPPQISITGG